MLQSNLKKAAVSFAAVAAILTSGCGGETEKYIESWKINVLNNKFNIHAVFNQQYEMDGEAMIRYKDYGTVYIGQDDNRRFTIDIALDKFSFNDVELIQTSTLPNGSNFPSIVTMPMAYTTYQSEQGKWKIFGYFGMQQSPKKTLAGVAIQMEGINNNFPVLSITQNYYTADNQRFASFTLYGPKLDQNGNVLVPGGLFLVGDINFLINGGGNVGSKLEVTGPDAHKYQDAESRKKLIEEVFRQAETAGIIRRK